MDVWRVSSDPETNGFTHVIDGGGHHALVVPIASAYFQELRVSASYWDGNHWWAIHEEPSLIPFEAGHGVESQRWAYNDARLREVLEKKRAVVGRHRGLADLFVPVLVGKKVAAVLVVGSYALERLRAADVQTRWHSLAGVPGDPGDPEFLAYLKASLATLVLEGDRSELLIVATQRLATLMGGGGRADDLVNELHLVVAKLRAARFAERMWDRTRHLLDERSSSAHLSPSFAYDLGQLGVLRAPDRVLVALCVARRPLDPVEDAVRRDAFQRAVVELARSEGNALVGQVGEHGVSVLLAEPGSERRKKQQLVHIAERIAALGHRKFGLRVHAGAGGRAATDLATAYQTALGVAELALARGAKLLFADERAASAAPSLRALREELQRIPVERVAQLPAEFDRYAEAVAAHCGYRLAMAHAQLELCFEGLAERFVSMGALASKSERSVRERLDRQAATATTLSDLCGVYRQAIQEVERAVADPVAARQAPGLRAAIDFIHRHYAEPLDLKRVARVAGFAPTYFSELFAARQGTPFQKYIAKLRLARAEQLLQSTDFSVTRIAELAGYRGPQYLCRVFLRETGTTPLAYRKKVLPDWFRKGVKKNRTKSKERTMAR